MSSTQSRVADPQTRMADRDRPLNTSAKRPQDDARQSGTDDDPSVDNDETSLQDWIEAENSRPTLPDETADGLDDLDEEVRRQAEDGPLDKA